MHEWALAEAVVTAAVEVARREGLSEVSLLTLRMGELQRIDREAFDFAMAELVKPRASLLGKAEVKIEKEPARFACRVCSAAWGLDDGRGALPGDEAEAIHFVPEMAHAFMRCPKCGSPDFEITHGRGIWLDSVTGDKRP
jgi:hydrogenase nickel incorporation protein HypA/HybF